MHLKTGFYWRSILRDLEIKRLFVHDVKWLSEFLKPNFWSQNEFVFGPGSPAGGVPLVRWSLQRPRPQPEHQQRPRPDLPALRRRTQSQPAEWSIDYRYLNKGQTRSQALAGQRPAWKPYDKVVVGSFPAVACSFSSVPVVLSWF